MRKFTKDEQDAIDKVNQLISDYRTQIEAITLVKDDIDMDPVLLTGETATGHACQMMVDPRQIAPILLDFDYPVYRILSDEVPYGMWEALATEFGLESVDSFDL